jgi:hypothetical protein
MAAIRTLSVRMATENRDWGYTRIHVRFPIFIRR